MGVRARYDDVAAAVDVTGMTLRGGFVPGPADEVPTLPGGIEVRTVLVVGNIGGRMWPTFRADERAVPDPLDDWTRRTLMPISERFGAGYVHPSDRPYIPVQRWAQRADDVFPSPIGLLVHPEHGLWHAYRGAFLFPVDVAGLPPVGRRRSPCDTCVDRPCLSACPVDAFAPGRYDHERCRAHVRSGREPHCRTGGCAARRACPVNADGYYDVDQMAFHMDAFVGDG
jgi:hypothetical protein